jgi:dimeric dUTPase (all-alpha-NTP-PPase superfamily)
MTLFLPIYFEMQRELDARILKKFNIDPTDMTTDYFTKLITALQVEVNECCNSWRGFKFWSQNTTSKHDVLEEYVDGLHFVLSIGNLLGKENSVDPSFPSGPDVGPPLQMFALVNKFVNMMHEDDYYAYLLMSFLDLGYSLGFTWPTITDAYRAKYKINQQRQEEGY